MNTYTITLTEEDVEMILNAMDYEYQNHTELDSEYRATLHDLYQLIDRLGEE